MARTGVRPAAPAPRRPKSTRPRPGVGRRRASVSTFSLLLAWLSRTETIGLSLLALALVVSVAVLPGLGLGGPLTDLIKIVGLNFFMVTALIAALGGLIWRRSASLILHNTRWVAAVGLEFLVFSGFLGLLGPRLTLAQVDLEEVSAGGDLGRFLVGSPAGVFIWLLTGLAFLSLAWPRGVAWTLRKTPVAAKTVWGWQIPHKLMAVVATFVDFAFPTKPPADEQPSQLPPSWLPREDEAAEPEVHHVLPVHEPVLQTG
jgi:hypothetical protein